MFENTAQPLQNKEGNQVELTFAKTCGTVTRDREKNQPIADRYLVTIPETIVGCISAPVPFSFLKWRITVIENSTRENVSAQIKSDCLQEKSYWWQRSTCVKIVSRILQKKTKKKSQKPTCPMLTCIVESHGEKKQKKIKNEFLKSWNGKLYLHKVLPSSFPQCSFSFFRAGFFSCWSLNPREHGNLNQGRRHSGYRLFQSVSQLKRFCKRLQSMPTPICQKQACVKYDRIFGSLFQAPRQW